MTQPSEETSPVTMKALAHPLRLRILRHLATAGPATATGLAAVLGENTGTLSYHLRRLEAGGLVEDAPDQPSGRERWWRGVRGLDFRRLPAGAGAASREVRRAATGLERLRAAEDRALLDRFHAEEPTGGGWLRGSRSISHLTREELNAFHDAYLALLARFARGPEEATPETRPVLLRWFGLPADPAESAEPADPGDSATPAEPDDAPGPRADVAGDDPSSGSAP